MRKATTSILLALLLLFSLGLQLTDARSGCCSHHGGVCGCGCCDGSSLSAICAPYYPECSNTSTSATTTTQGQTSTPTPTPTIVRFTPRPTATPKPSPTPTVTPKPT